MQSSGILHRRSPWQVRLSPTQQGPMSPRPSELWLMLLLPTGPINPPLFPLCHTVLATQRAQQLTPPQPCYAQCWHSQNSFPPSRCPSLWSPFLPPPPPAPSLVLLDFHQPGQHAARSGCGCCSVASPSLTFPLIPSNLGCFSLSLHPFLVLHGIPLSAHLGSGWERSPFSMFS